MKQRASTKNDYEPLMNMNKFEIKKRVGYDCLKLA